MHDPGAVRDSIFEYARQLGFSACGVAEPDAAQPELNSLRVWLAAGYSGELGYMQRNPDARCDARSLLPGCRSVIVVALDCSALNPVQATDHKGKLARYTQGEDYHAVICVKLNRLANTLEQLAPGQQCKICVDTSPLMEKAFAIAAGIGWRGRHTLVMNDRQGSFLMLGLLLTTALLPANDMMHDRCGHCRRCLDACPTKALAYPGLLDVGKCISYWTTAVKGDAPADIDLHGWSKGCDTCQEACPFNMPILANWPLR